MRKILALLCVVLFCGSAYAAKYPEMGICTGEKVRLIESPSSKGKIIGLVKPDRNRFVVLGEVHSGGQKWYMIDHPTKRGTAYVAAEYVEITPVGNVFAEVRLTFGVYPEKTRAIFGRPLGNGSQHLGERERYNFWYDENGIWSVSVMHTDEKAIAGIRISDNARKLLTLGMPESALHVELDDDDEAGYPMSNWIYDNEGAGEHIYFQFSDENGDGEFLIDNLSWYRDTEDD